MIGRRYYNPIRRIAPLAAVLFLAVGIVSHAAPGDGISELKSAVALLQAKQGVAAMTALRPLAARLPKIADYVAWFLASAQFESQQYAEIPKTLSAVWTQVPPSPLTARSAILAGRAYVMAGDPRAGVEILRKYYAKLPQPQGDAALAEVYTAAGDDANAVLYQQRVYYAYPMSAEAAAAEPELARLRTKLGEQYPPALGVSILSRANKLLEAGQTGRARTEFTAMLTSLTGAERDSALVKLGVADYQQRQNVEARRYLAALTVENADADAERLYYLVLCARRANDRDGMAAVLTDLERKYPASLWRLQALAALADAYLVENNSEAYEPFYRACYEAFPKNQRADGCHWKVAMSHYLHRSGDAGTLLREHLERYPNSDESPAALYFLGTLAQDAGDTPSARAFWSEVIREYPNHYHASIARQKLGSTSVADNSPASSFLRTVAFPTRVRTRDFEANALTKVRLERSRLLRAADLDEWADTELRFAAQTEDQPHLMGLELASVASQKGFPDQAIRYLKRYAPDYLYLPVESAPMQFWRLAFPLPYRTEIEKQARINALDPYFLAALVRQESEFDAKAVSGSNARGLTQVMPTTGKELSRRLGVKPFSTARLFQPAVNLQLGAYFLRTILDRLDGHQEATLAAYNAGPSRASQWLTWANFRDPVEFVEAVPFSQTRNYIQVVLRNAEMYRRIWGEPAKSAQSVAEVPAARPPVRTVDNVRERRQAGRGASSR